jgi:hypothetical protein
MITDARINSAFGRARTVATISALLAAACLAHAKDEPKDTPKLPEGISAVTKEHLLSKVPNFFSFDYPYEPLPGKRLWLRVDDGHWLERYPDGTESKFKIMGRTTAHGEDGTVVVKIEGDPEKTGTDNSGRFQVFIPDKGNKELAILFRMGDEQEWKHMSWSDNRKTEIQKVE